MGLKRFFNKLRAGHKLDAQGADGETLLTSAVRFGDPQTVLDTLDAGANINVPNARGQTPLMLAIVQGDKKIFRLLIENKADVTHIYNGKTAPDFARAHGREDMAQVLADVIDREDNYAHTLRASTLGGAGAPPPPSRKIVFHKRDF